MFGGLIPNTVDEGFSLWAFVAGLTVAAAVTSAFFGEIEDSFSSSTGIFPALGGKGA